MAQIVVHDGLSCGDSNAVRQFPVYWAQCFIRTYAKLRDMMREAVISLSDAELDALGLDELVSVFQAAGLRDFEEFACYGNGAVVQVEVNAPSK